MSDKAVCKQIIKTILIDGLVDGASSPPNTSVIHDSNDDDDDESHATVDIDMDGLLEKVQNQKVFFIQEVWLDL